jgi:DNA-binding MarR family transcriptional regulator
MNALDTGRLAAQSIKPPHRRTTTVHPGWLVPDQIDHSAIVAQIDEEACRFNAFSQLMRTAGALDRAATDALSDLGLTAGAFFALLELDAAGEDGVAPSELARRLAVARRTATLYVDILTRQGWVERSAHPDDRRMVLARLTPSGLRLIGELAEAYKRRLAGLLGEINSLQSERLRQLLSQIPLADQGGAHSRLLLTAD